MAGGRTKSVDEVPKATQLRKKAELLTGQLNRAIAQAENSKLVQDWSKGRITEHRELLHHLNAQLREVQLQAACELDADDLNGLTENEELSEATLQAKGKLSDHLQRLENADPSCSDMIAIGKNKITVEVSQQDTCSNIQNVWGKFDGDYSKWQSFHDKWVASVHKNKKIPAVTKFQLLQTACVGTAKNTLGEWDLTKENYKKAWHRLRSIYEDDYMQVQSFMRNLDKLPQMDSSSKTIRDTIDIVQKHIHGLKRYMSTGDQHPYIVFMVIKKMDSDTYRAWEKHRPSLALANAKAYEAKNSNESSIANELNIVENVNNDDDSDDDDLVDGPEMLGKYIPTWKELERFLENEVSIRVHSEKHRSEARPKLQATPKQTKHVKKREGITPSNIVCTNCDGPHTIYSCEDFTINKNLVAKMDRVTERQLCTRCLLFLHDGPCKNKRNNLPCRKCLPDKKYHNSLLCPNMKPSASAMKASGTNRKRGSLDKSHQIPKRRRGNSTNRPAQNTPSAVNKVGDWMLMSKHSNAITNYKQTPKGKFDKVVMLATLNMRIKEYQSNEIFNCRAIVDTGATLNCISTSFVSENLLPTYKCQKRILGVSGPEIIKRKLKATLRPWFDSNITINTEFYILKQLDGHYPDRQINVDKSQISHLTLADENFDTPAPIDALLGVEIYAEIIGSNFYKHKDGAIMQSTDFGFIVLGKFYAENQPNNFPTLSLSLANQNNHAMLELNNSNDNAELQRALAKFWEIEDINKCESEANPNEEQKMVEEIFTKTCYREPNGRYVVTIPIKPDCIGLGNSKFRAKSQFLQLERRFKRDPELKQKYVEYMNESMALGYMKPAKEPEEGELCYWLPHHAVTKKFRVVLNASEKTSNGESLNSIQMIGGKLQYDAQLQTMRFRRHKHAATTDITKMFNRIGLNPKQWNLHRMFWRESESQPLKEYVMAVVIFGEASSPYNAVRAMQQNAKDYAAKYPHAAEVIQKSFYMDDGMFGCDELGELKILCKEVEFVLSQGHFMLKGWDSNSLELEEYMNVTSTDEICIGDKDETKILGLRWLKKSDELTIAVKLDNPMTSITKRTILGEIARLYDPNGFIAPIVIKAKMLMQDIWRLKEIDWDSEVPTSIVKDWMEIYESLPMLSSFKIKRWLKMNKNSKIQIHGFCDASGKAYGTSIYVRTENASREISCTLLSAKSRVAPLKDMTIPRLELLAALMLSEQLTAIVEACELQNAEITLWSDSMITLSWINKAPKELKAFVANRVQTIQNLTKKFKWKHVCSADNPADLVSRGMRMSDFLKSNLWLEGPVWLSQSEQNWPLPRMTISPEVTLEIEKECKKKIAEARLFKIHSGAENAFLYTKFNNWNKIVNITAYVLRMLRKKQNGKPAYGKYVRADERCQAIELWIKHEQSIAYKKEIDCLMAKDVLPSNSSIAPLRPFLDKNGIVRVGGRIDKADIAFGNKHQYIIPPKTRLSYLILSNAHESTLHGGAQMMTQFIRRFYWIPKLRFEVRAFIKTCIPCVKQAQDTAKQIMADLPEIRLKPAHPFQNVGVDMAGPYTLRVTNKIHANTRARNLPDTKGWIAVFVCLVTRAVHLEAVEGMSADDFLNAYTKFTSRRGEPEKIYSDHGTNFVGADKTLQSAAESWQTDKVQRFVHTKGSQWHFITPAAPHEGGIWEAAVKQMKHHLKRVIGTQKYSFQAMSTLIAGVEACLNSRPICRMTEDPEDLQPLTPAHFLIGRPLIMPMHEKTEAPPKDLNRLYLQLQFQIQAFWKQWANDYLQSLIQLPKSRSEQENLKIDQLVIIKADNVAPTYWSMGRIIKVNKGSDHKIRSVLLKTQNGQLERSIRKICVLPSDVELAYWQ